MTTRSRVPAGVTTGGQFATEARSESDVTLAAPSTSSPTAPAFNFERDLLAATDPGAPAGSVAARRRMLAELADEATWDEAADSWDIQPSIESSSLRFMVKHNRQREIEPTWATTPAGARAAVRGSRAPGRIVQLRGLRGDLTDPLEVTGHASDPIQVNLPGFGAHAPLRVTKGTAVIHAGDQERLAFRTGKTANVDVTVAPGANVLIFGAKSGEVNVTVEGDGVAVVVGERYTTGTLTQESSDGSLDVVGPTSAAFAITTMH